MNDGDEQPRAIIAGFGIAGRFVAELLKGRGIPFVVIDQNPTTAQRCTSVRVIVGNATDEQVLRSAGLEQATVLAIALPDDDAVLATICVARSIRADLRIFARVNYTSNGLKAQQLGAEAVIVAEQLVAKEFFRLVDCTIGAMEPASAAPRPQ